MAEMSNTMSYDQLLENAEPEGHLVQLYDADEELLTRNVSSYLWEGLKLGDGLLVVATPDHREAIPRRLEELGADHERAVREGRLVFLDAQETLDRFMVDGQPDWDRFEAAVGSALREVHARVNGKGLRVHGEMVGILWKAGQRSAAIRLEKFWNKLLTSITFNLFCAYPIDVFGDDFQLAEIDGLLCAHTHLLPGGAEADIESAVNRAMDEILGARAERLRPLIKANYRPSWAAIPRAEAMVLWLRNNLPDYAHEILDRARQYYRASQCPKSMSVGS
jgi:hypothetical protein